MLSALLFGLIASSALVIGGAIGAYQRPPERLVAVALAFASGALITALATDLFVDPFRTGGALFAGIGLLTGAAAFVLADSLLDRYVKRAGGSVLVAIFASNLPEALGGAVSMMDQGRTRGFAIIVWAVTAVILAAAVVLGNAALSGVSHESLSVLLAFAGGAVLASLADTLMPDAYREGGKLVAFATAAGFFVSFVISEL